MADASEQYVESDARGLFSSAESNGATMSAAGFGPAVAPHHRRIDTDAWDDIYVVGDVHGCLDRLHALLDRIDPSDDDLVLFVGDLIRKGPDSRGVVDLVLDSPNMLSVRGNNEAKFVRGEKDIPALEPVREAIESMPVAVSFDENLVVHGGVDPRKPLAEHSVLDLQETRAIPDENGYDGPFWWDVHDGPMRVFFGHTVHAEPLLGEWAVGLDTGCVYGGRLTAYDYHADEVVAVDGHEHEGRAERKILDPTL
jgi:serine/threonine protein phosphatase 1